MLPKNREPTHAGEILLMEFLEPLEMSQTKLARLIGMTVPNLNMLIKGHRGVTAETAIKLGKVFKTTPQFWMNIQQDCDLWHAQRRLAAHG